MNIHFYKYQGTGNDFIIMDNRTRIHDALTKEQVAFLCHRRFGIGADGLMLLNEKAGYDFEMIYYNSDGAPSSMCGNGGRCLVKFAYDLGFNASTFKFIAVDGEHEATINKEGLVSLKMQDVSGVVESGNDFVLDTGSPHYVKMQGDLWTQDVVQKGKDIRYSAPFSKEGINVNFVETVANKILVRTYERGVEDETFSCGTGVTAAALVCAQNQNGFNRIEVETKGGPLSVEFNKSGDHYSDIWLTGPAVKVFDGTIEL